MKIYICWIVILTIVFTVTKTKCSKITDIAKAKNMLHLTLESLKKNLEFLNSEKENVNLDAIIGTRMVDGERFIVWFTICSLHEIRVNLNTCSLFK